MNVLLSTAYWPNLHYFFYVLNSENISIEQCENYQKQSFKNRTQILSANGLLNLTIPVVNGNHKQQVKDIKICYRQNWQKNHWRAIISAYKNSPYFEFFEEDIKQFYFKEYSHLFEFNRLQLQLILKLLKYPKQLNISENFKNKTENQIDLRNTIHPKVSFKNDSIVLNKLNTAYYQTFETKFGFCPNLSVLDSLFNIGLNTLNLLKS